MCFVYFVVPNLSHPISVYSVYSVVPCRRTISGDNSLAALEGFGDDESEVLGERRENENIAPVPNLLKLFAIGIRYKSHAEVLRG